MDIGLLSLLILGSMLILLLTGLPVALILIVIAFVPVMVIKGPAALTPMASATFTSITRDVFLALPQFIFMAAVLEMSGLGSAMYDLMHKWMAGLRGGLAMGTIGIATAMAAMSGSASTATLTMGMLAYPEMERRGYDKRMAIGCIPAGGVLGPLIPPSVLMIIVASVSATSIGKLFMAGFIPGLLMSLGFMAYIGIRCFFRPAMGPPLPVAERVGWSEKIKSVRGAFLPFLLILLVLGLIYTGVCAPSEAGGVGAVGALISAAIYGNLNLRSLQKATIRCLQITAMLMFLLITAAYFGQMMGILGIQVYIKDLLTGAEVSRWVILASMLGLVFFMGMFMDDVPITVIFLPIFFPIAKALGFDLLWFVFLFSLDEVIGLITPPFGMVLFYFKGLNIQGVTMMDIYRSIFPYVLIAIGVLLLVILFPPLALWLPSTMIG